MESLTLKSLSAAEKLALIEKAIPTDIVSSFKKWCEEHSDEDYQLDEVGEFLDGLYRSEKLELLEAMENIANILKLT